MAIIKEYLKDDGSYLIIMRHNHYGHSHHYIQQLFEEARKYFPNLDSTQVEICHYGGENYRGTYGIEFYQNSVTQKLQTANTIRRF